MSIPNHEILIESDAETEGFYTIWEPGSAIGMGTTEKEALDDLRGAIHFYIDTMVDSKLREINHNMSLEGEELYERNRTETDQIGNF